MDMNEGKIKFTEDAIQELKEELKERKTKGREDIRTAIGVAKSFGDLSENSEYEAARHEQDANEARIREIEEILSHAVVVDDSSIDTSLVSIGTKVTIWDLDNDKEEIQYSIVSKNDVNPLEHKISEESPIGNAICGRHELDNVTVETPAGTRHFQIRRIERS